MKLRAFIVMLAAAATWPLPLGAQQPMPVIGFLSSASAAEWTPYLDSFRRGLTWRATLLWK